MLELAEMYAPITSNNAVTRTVPRVHTAVATILATVADPNNCTAVKTKALGKLRGKSERARIFKTMVLKKYF